MNGDRNAKVTQAEVYKAILDLRDVMDTRFNGVDARFGTLEESLSSRVNCIDERLNTHTANNNHPSAAKSTGFAGLIAAAIVAITAVIESIIKRY